MSKYKSTGYVVFVRNWWRWESAGISGGRIKVPHPGAPKRKLAIVSTEEEARAMCAEYAATHAPGPLSRKAEYTAIDNY